MSRNKKSLLYLILFACIGLVGNQMVLAQSIWLERSHDKTIDLEILKPDFEGESDISFATSSWFLTGRFPVSESISIIAEIPYSYYKSDSEYGENQGENAFGNPYIGMELKGETSPTFGEFGIRIPLVPEDDASSALLSGILTEFVDRAEAFSTDILPVYAMFNYMKVQPSGFTFRLRGGPVAWFATGDRNETEWILLYGAQAGYQSQKFNLLAGVSGRWFISAEDADFAESSFHQLGLSANVVLGVFKPGIIFKLPLDDDMKQILDLVFGLTLGFNLN
jgi:hypothetical protein